MDRMISLLYNYLLVKLTFEKCIIGIGITSSTGIEQLERDMRISYLYNCVGIFLFRGIANGMSVYMVLIDYICLPLTPTNNFGSGTVLQHCEH